MEIKKISEIDPDKANEEYVDLMNICFGSELKYSDRLFFKKHIENPFGKSYGNFIYEGKKLIATNFNLRWEFISQGRIIKSAQVLDVQVHPDFQGKGVFRIGQEACLKASDQSQVLFSFPNNKSKPGFLQWGWELSARYVTKIYPVSWMSFMYKRCVLKKKNFKPKLASSRTEFFENKEDIKKFIEIIKLGTITNYSYELFLWKLSLNPYLDFWFLKNGSKVIAVMFYSISTINDYVLLNIHDFIEQGDVESRSIVHLELERMLKKNLVDEIQYSGSDHGFLEGMYTAVKSSNAAMIVYPHCGAKDDFLLLQQRVPISKLVTDHI